MSDLNDVKLYGRVVKDAELSSSETTGTKILKFSVATNKSKKKADGTWEDVVYFFPLTIFGNYAEKMHKYLVKGQKVIVEGFLRQDKWEKEGVKKSAISIGVNNIHLIFDSKKQNDSDVNFEYVEEPYVEEDVYIDNEEYGCES